MDDILDAGFRRLIVEDLGSPPITFGALAIARDTWPAVLPRLLPIERRRLLRLPALRRHLVFATEPARERYRRWRRDVTPVGPLPAATLRDCIDARLQHYGDSELLPIVIDALLCVPRYVRDAVLAECAFLAVGLSSCAWTASANFVDVEGRARTRVVVLSAAANRETALHEIGHAWFLPVPTAAVTSQGEVALAQLACDEGWSARAHEHVLHAERLACAFAMAFAP